VRRYLAALLAGLSLAGAPAHAGLFDDEEARKWITELRKTIDGIDQRVADAAKQSEVFGRNQLDFANQMENLKAELARVRGEIEVLRYELEAAQKRQKDFYVDLDSRLRVLETKPEPKDETPKVDPQAEATAYETAVSALKASQFKVAADGFLAFIQTYPTSSMLASAHYWGGYAHSQLKDHVRAADLFGRFVAGWPLDERAPGALESQVAALESAKDLKGAKVALELLADKYPASDAGKRAKLRLKKK
jgi:tol-pal system protein YbgF